jgi:hypothetical protein
MKLEISPKQVISDSYMVLSLLTFLPGFILDPMRRARAVQYLLFQWRPDDIARELQCGVDTIYRMQRNLWMYGAPYAPRRQTMGCPRKMTKRTEDLLIPFGGHADFFSAPGLTA